MNAALLTELGRALGCDLKVTAAPEPKIDGLPERCYFTGPLSELGPPAPRVSRNVFDDTYMAREARELALRARADIIQFVQMRARYAARTPKPRADRRTA